MDGSLEEQTPSLNSAQGDGSQGQPWCTALGQVGTASGQVAAATGQDNDADFIQSIFSCPITKVGSQLHTCMRHVALLQTTVTEEHICIFANAFHCVCWRSCALSVVVLMRFAFMLACCYVECQI